MKITVERANTRETHPTGRSAGLAPPSDLSHKSSFMRKPPRRKSKTPRFGVLLRREVGVSSVKRSSHPDTPLLKWKVDEGNEESDSEKNEKSLPKAGRGSGEVVSARKLAAGLWRLHLPEFQIIGGRSSAIQVVFLSKDWIFHVFSLILFNCFELKFFCMNEWADHGEGELRCSYLAE